MKAITVRFTEDQIELLENLSQNAGKTSSDFIKETIFALLPLSEYSAVKKHLDSIQKGKNKAEDISTAKRIIKNIQASANARLKRIGVL
ncbi:hypothetical protein B6D60_07695 [candidate division KSB1 bacterium 4484_87]|nr:MAG: hypothetical protein B6D60_07695 [candidate division KSB1 bacterium 4484_87]